MQVQQSARHWSDILWFLFVSAILGLTCGLTAGGVALLLAAPAYGKEAGAGTDAEAPRPASLHQAADNEETEEDAEEPLVCTSLVLRGAETIVVCRPRIAPAILVRDDAKCCSPS